MPVRMQALADVESKIASAVEKGMERGMEKGMDKAARAIALNLIKAGTSIDIIAHATGLSESEIEQLRMTTV